jgi:integral membrane sensor domain MASE1
VAALARLRNLGDRVVVGPRQSLAALIPASFAGFAIADLQAGVPLSSIAWFIPGNTVEVLISAIGLKYCFDGVPRLNSVKALAKYAFFAIMLGRFAGAFLSAHGIARGYWAGWKIVFLSEALAFITLTPALFSWMSEGRLLMRRSRAHQLEGVLLIAGLILVSYIMFTVPEDSRSLSLIAVTSLSILGRGLLPRSVFQSGPPHQTRCRYRCS